MEIKPSIMPDVSISPNDVAKFMRDYLEGTVEIEIIGNDDKTAKLKLSPIPVEKLPDAYETTSILEGMTESNPMALLKNITPAISEKIAELGVLGLKPNYPEIAEETLKAFVKKNLLVFATAIWEQNLGFKAPESDKIKKIKERQAMMGKA